MSYLPFCFAAIGNLLKEAAQYLSSELSLTLPSSFSEQQVAHSSKSLEASKVNVTILPCDFKDSFMGDAFPLQGLKSLEV